MTASNRPWWKRPRLWATAVVLFAALVRFPAIEWDQRHFFHPDERAVAFAIQRISFTRLALDPDWFAYGTLPIYLNRALAEVLSLIDPRATNYDEVIINGRRLTAFLGSLTVLLLFRLGARMYDPAVGATAAFLLAGAVLHVQNSRFLTVDVPLTFFVLLALSQLVWAAEKGWWKHFLFAGAAVGAAMATKFSAAPLFLPLVVAGALRWRAEGRFGASLGKVAAAVLLAGATFAIAQPYALLNFSRYAHDILEQSNMVRNAGLFPYTNQYMHTPKYLYELTQLVLWCMAPALGLVSVWAAALRPAFAWREGRAGEWVLLSWVVPFFLVTGWFEVKFPRYLLPIYPVLCLWAAEWLVRQYRSGIAWRRLLLPAVLVGNTLAVFAFLSIYTRPHTVRTASEWFYRNIPAGSKVLSQDWDEGFPFPVPGFSPNRYHIVTFSYYEPDSVTKIRRLARELATSDYIVFQTKRIYGAVTRAPEKFPLTTNYFYQLFAGDLGYTLLQEFASRPSLFGWEAPDELADESFSVYDHPKVLVFQNTGRLGEEEIAERILHRPPSRPLTRNDLLLARPSAEGVIATGGGERIRSSLLALVLFAALVELLGLSLYPLVRHWFVRPGTLGLAKPLGVLLFAYCAWLLAGWRIAPFSQGTLGVLTVIFLLVGAFAWRAHGRVRMSRGEILATEGIFWVVFAFFLAVRAFNPEIYWGEKPMDFSFLNVLYRTTYLPPPEPWFAGSPLHYSYFGYFMIASLGKALGIDPALAYNLGIALIAGLTAAAVFAAGTMVSDRWGVGLLAAFLAVMIGNLAGPRELWGAHRSINFDYYWATSRVIRDTINEFPFWSFLFADLHAHVMVMPLTMTFVALMVRWIRSRVMSPPEPLPASNAVVLLLLLALTLGAITTTNTWSTPTYVLLLVYMLGSVWLTESEHRGFGGYIFGFFVRVVLVTAVVVGLAYLFFWPYWATFVAPERNFGWERLPPWRLVQPFDLFTIFGTFLLAIVPFVWRQWGEILRSPTGRWSSLHIAGWVIVGSLPVLGFFVSTRVGMAVLFLLTLQLLLAPRTSREWRIALALASFGLAIPAGTDLVYLWDRMNTIFKFYLEAWFFFSLSAAAMAVALWSGTVDLGPVRRLWQVAFVAVIAVGLFTAVTDVMGILRTNRVPTPKPTLDGMAYLRLKAPDEYAAIEWLNRNVKGIPYLLEAHGDAYQEFTRVAMNTGLPTVLGWAYHVYQRAHSWNEINRRKADVTLAYTTEDKDVLAQILERYKVSLVYVGALERRTYAGGNLERFRSWTDLLTPVYQNPGVTIFAVNGRFAGSLPVTTIEEVLPAGTPEAEAPRAPDAPGVLSQPRGVAVAPDGSVVVCDFGNNRMQVFRRDLSFVRTFGRQGELPGQFKEPCGVAVGPKGEIYVADTWNGRVQVFDAEGKYLREFGEALYGPRGIAVDAAGNVFLADTGNNRIVRYSARGEKQVEWGRKGNGPGEFWEPTGIVVDSAGTVFVADNGNGRVQFFQRDGRFLGSFPVRGWESKVFSEPHLTLDARGNLCLTVPGDKEVRCYDRAGKLLLTIRGDGSAGVVFETPMGIAFDAAAGELVITDLENRIVRIRYGGK
ncbi:Serine/threonine-protein kinase PknD [bacterium HR30]|nr:Serine/threonine-protein kinase PknD [bacterium HR30]